MFCDCFAQGSGTAEDLSASRDSEGSLSESGLYLTFV